MFAQTTYTEVEGYGVTQKLNSYKKVKLTTDLSHLSQAEKDALYYMIEAAKNVNPIFWRQTFGDDYKKLLDGTTGDLHDFIELNYGPWDRLANDAVFVNGFDAKLLGANYYSPNLDPEKLKELPKEELNNQYSVLRTNQENHEGDEMIEDEEARDVDIMSIRYSEEYGDEIGKIADNLMKAMFLLRASDLSYSEYLERRVQGLSMDDYNESDIAWLNQKIMPWILSLALLKAMMIS